MNKKKPYPEGLRKVLALSNIYALRELSLLFFSFNSFSTLFLQPRSWYSYTVKTIRLHNMQTISNKLNLILNRAHKELFSELRVSLCA